MRKSTQPDKEIKELARYLLKMKGYSVPDDFDFKNDINPRSREVWLMAEFTYKFWAARIPAKGGGKT